MKLLVLSDLHLEFCNFQPPETADAADVVVLAGDIWQKDRGIYWARSTWPYHDIIYVPGNHEFYREDRLETLALMRSAAEECDVHLLDNDEVVIRGVRFLGTTMWTDFGLFGEELEEESISRAQQRLNDFRVIQEGNRTFTPSDSVQLHQASIAWLEMKLKNESFDGLTVVISHHLPSKLSVAEQFKDDLITACFASNLDYLLGLSELWIHGHTHVSFDYQVQGTRVVCNPRGYCRQEMTMENSGFKPDLLVQI